MTQGRCDPVVGQRQPIASAILRATLMSAVVAVLALSAPRIIGSSESASVPPSFITHSVMLGLSVALSAWLTKGQIAKFGFTKGLFHLQPNYSLWVLPMLIVSTLQLLGSRSSAPSN